MRGRLLLGLAFGLLISCASDTEDQQDTVPFQIIAYGEEYVEDHIPAEDVIDGWRIEFDEFLIVLANIEAKSVSGPRVSSNDSVVLDLKKSSGGIGHPTLTLDLVAGEVESVSYSVLPASSATTSPNASAADLQKMKESGYSIFVRGVANRGPDEKRFTWGFKTTTVYSNCETEAIAGIKPSWLTIHADHFFYDDFLTEPNVAFDLIASADTNGDGEVTEEELRALDITGESRYQVGSLPITNLWEFIEAQSKTLGHIDGEGHCDQN